MRHNVFSPEIAKMKRAYNFHAGPAGLPAPVLREAADSLLAFEDAGASIMEVSHRGRHFLRVYEETEQALREALDAPQEYRILFLAGGARGQAAAIPMNLLGGNPRAAYMITGLWSQFAWREGRRFCEARVIADESESGFRALPDPIDAAATAECAYLHYADNETVHGVEFPAPPPSAAPLAADMSSNILSRPIRVSDYGLIYAGAQKNLGPAGVTIVVVREDMLREELPGAPEIWRYREQARRQSMINTPPTFNIYLVGLVLRWLKAQGGAAAMARASAEKSRRLYAAIDASDFYSNPVRVDSRSRMNAPFFLADDSLTGAFVAAAEAAGLIGLKGHAAVGGIRASLYNSMPLAGVDALVDFMKEFERARG